MAESSASLYVTEGKYYATVGCESCNYNEVNIIFRINLMGC